MPSTNIYQNKSVYCVWGCAYLSLVSAVVGGPQPEPRERMWRDNHTEGEGGKPHDKISVMNAHMQAHPFWDNNLEREINKLQSKPQIEFSFLIDSIVPERRHPASQTDHHGS